MTPWVKICGLNSANSVTAALAAGADMVGLVFYPPSPRAVTADEAARLAQMAEGRAERVGLFVNPTDAALDSVLGRVDLDWIQLHGEETPARLAQVKARGLRVMKALRIRDAADLDAAAAHAAIADRLLLDAPPPDGPNALPGGNGEAFDWCLLKGRRIGTDWMLAGGLNPENITRAIAETAPPGVDVSSGVESAPGLKDPARIQAFLKAARAAWGSAAC